MGIKTTLAGIAPSSDALARAANSGFNAAAMLQVAQDKVDEIISTLKFLNSDILTPAGDSSNASALSTLITDLG
jgi:hypothetical protein